MIYIILKLLFCLTGVIAGLAVCAAVCHHIMLLKESSAIVPNGMLVSVDGHNMHIYAEGKKSTPTLVIMSGSGHAAPVYDYKVLYSRFSDQYRVVVIEKFGYGYSDVSALPRDVETMTRENREALSLAGENAPYILLPHSMSALEAIYWAVNFPGEVSAIIGLDMAVPEEYAPFTNKYIKMKFQKLAVMLGLHRIPFFNPVSERGLSPDEVKQHKYLSYKVTLNNDVMTEAGTVNENAKKVQQLGVPDIPILLFVSSSIGEQWIERQHNFAKNSEKIKVIQLNCGHDVHYDEPEYIASESRRFIKELFGK
ncbi:MAG: alpha/beta hydrolase [Treponema sp.]|nr:alpha/beta hydrolase [Treponema sp.]